MTKLSRLAKSGFFSICFLLTGLTQLSAHQPEVGAKAPDFVLSTPENKPVRLADVVSKGPVALVVLRGYPGYQCPFCNRQVQDLIKNAPAFLALGVQIVAVYPGPPQDLGSKANEFLSGKTLPGNFTLVLDPGYQLTDLYGLRWDAERETAYPSTFLIDPKGVIFFSKVVKAHGSRASSAEMLEAMSKHEASR